jgi:hypothetical protein
MKIQQEILQQLMTMLSTLKKEEKEHTEEDYTD